MNYLGVNGIVLAHGSGSIITGGTFTITSTPSTKNKAGGQGIYFGTLSFTFAGGSASGCDPSTVTGAGTINPGSIKIKDVLISMFAMLQNDVGSGVFAGTLGGNPVPLGSQPVKVSNANQSKVKGN
jgi:hypothetical protein